MAALRGFTIIELVITIGLAAALSIVAFAAIWSSVNAWRLESATAQVINHIRYAQHLARTRNGWYGIRFQANPTNQYNVYFTDGSTDTDVPNPANLGEDLNINVNTEYDGVTISAVSIASGDKVEFNPIGTPYDDMSGSALASTGTVTLALGGSTKTIDIIKNTGMVEIQ